jgi:uncharacterized RDD family membrane protein YckC
MCSDEHVDVHDEGDTTDVQPEQQVVTGEAVAVELRLAGPGSRGIAALIDYLVVVAAQFLLLFVTLFDGANDAAIFTVVLVIEVLILLGYPVVMETLWRGRTLGKAAMGLRVVRDDGGPIHFRHAFVRGLMGLFVDKPGLTSGLGALIPMIASSRNKRLGDMAAGTIVLQDRMPGQIDAPVFMPPALAGWAAGLDLSGIDDGLALRMRHFLGRAPQLSPQVRVALEQQLAAEAAARIGQPPAGAPGWAVISAVLAERRRRALGSSQPAPPPWPGHQPISGTAPPPAVAPAAPPDSPFVPPS